MAKKPQILLIDSRQPKPPDLEIINFIPEIELLGKLSYYHLKLESAETTFYIWQELIACLEQNYNDYDGFIVLCQPDQLIYFANACDVAFIKLSKTIIFTAAPFSRGSFSLLEQTADLALRSNIINSMQLIKSKINSVLIMYGRKAILAEKARKVNITDAHAFVSIDNSYIAEMDLTLRISSIDSEKAKGFKVVNNFSDNILIIYIYPGWPKKELINIAKKKSAVVIKCNDQRGLEENDKLFIYKALSNIPVLIYNRLGIEPVEDMPDNFIFINNSTWEKTIVKTMWLVAQRKKINYFKKSFSV